MPIFAGNAPVLAMGAPISVAAAGTLVSGWFDVRQAPRIRALASIGAGGGTPALSFAQANTAAGGGSKALSGWSIGAVANARIDVDNPSDKLDQNGGFFWVQVTVTITGGTGTITSLHVFGEDSGNAA